ncbi:MAG TPA: hypothetical protein VGU70_09215 [Methylobacterium sp.]|jgi:hypothetical protein|nr:hypothetical protein [Methylobacterium sp.]
MRLAWHLPGVDEAHQAKEDAFEAIEPVAEAILALPASTPAGFAVKARVLIWGQWPGGQYGETAEEGLHNDYGQRCARLLIESACAAAGVDWRGEPVSGHALPLAAASLADQILAGWREYGTDVGMSDEEASEHTQALGARRYALIDAAEALPATRENVLAKALALAWLDYGEHWRNGQARGAYTIDGRLAFDIDTAICGRMLTEY